MARGKGAPGISASRARVLTSGGVARAEKAPVRREAAAARSAAGERREKREESIVGGVGKVSVEGDLTLT